MKGAVFGFEVGGEERFDFSSGLLRALILSIRTIHCNGSIWNSPFSNLVTCFPPGLAGVCMRSARAMLEPTDAPRAWTQLPGWAMIKH